MRAQIGGGTRDAMLREIRRISDDRAAHFTQLATNQTRIGHLSDANRTVNAFVEQINDPVSQIQRHMDAGVGVHERRDQRRHMAAPEPGRRRNLEVAVRSNAAHRNRCFRVGQIGKYALAVFQKRLPFEGERQLSRRPKEQLYAEASL